MKPVNANAELPEGSRRLTVDELHLLQSELKVPDLDCPQDEHDAYMRLCNELNDIECLLESEHEIYILDQEDGWHFFYVRAPLVN